MQQPLSWMGWIERRALHCHWPLRRVLNSTRKASWPMLRCQHLLASTRSSRIADGYHLMACGPRWSWTNRFDWWASLANDRGSCRRLNHQECRRVRVTRIHRV